ncbi:MAG: DUF2953 domain-containing protein, partial [Clostridia bacterium]|nr:DUF2953 domain-containing protein [Clostridia bacterium]
KQERKKKNKDKPEETDGKPDEGSEQSKKKEDKEKKTKKESSLEKKVRNLGMSDYLTLFGYVKDMLGKLRFGDLCINLVFGSDDASKTAVIYGAANAAVFPFIGKVHSGKKADYIDVHINADFASETTFADVYAEIYLRTVHAVALLFKALVYIMKKKENENGK